MRCPLVENSLIPPDLRERIAADYQRMCHVLGRTPALPEDLTREERACAEFLYAYMPVSDAASYPEEFFVESVRAALHARRQAPWGAGISGELFLNYVLPCRVNNEDLTAYREPFFKELYSRVRSCSLLEAALEINYWCFEKATYQSTDTRTLSPLGVIKNAFGRCGEESTFLTAALRSAGIPARQCYAPRWSHCDDNHAWVEFWDGERWRFTGACEPDFAADRGWFTSSARRAMLVHARAFSGLVSEPGVTNRSPVLCEVNILGHYAPTRVLHVRVRDKNSRPIAGAAVSFQIINFAELYSLCVQKTDARGDARFETGLGDLFVHVSFGGRMLEEKVDMRTQEGPLTLDWSASRTGPTEYRALDLIPPDPPPAADDEPAFGTQKEHEKKVARCAQLRKAYEETFLRGEKAAEFARGFCQNPFGAAHEEKIAELIAASNGNHGEIAAFLSGGPDLDLRVLLLQSLSVKDLSDVSAAVLEEHLRYAAPFRAQVEEHIYAKYLLNPRIHHERLTPYRAALDRFFSDEEKAALRARPEDLRTLIDRLIAPADRLDYAAVSAAPAGLLKLGAGSVLSKRILSAAVLRTLGVPARLCPVDGQPEYWRGGWHPLNPAARAESRAGRLTLKNAPDEPELVCGKNFSVARLMNGDYVTLCLAGEAQPGNTVSYDLPAGSYRVTVIHRTAQGGVLAGLYAVSVEEGRETAAAVRIRSDSIRTAWELPEITLLDERENAFPLARFSEGTRRAVAFIKPGTEPTEHLFNEILEQKERFCLCADRILFVLEEPGALDNATLRRVRAALPITAAFSRAGCFAEDTARLARAAESPSCKDPFVLILEKDAGCVYRCAGYNVGTGEMLLRYMELKAGQR